MRIWEFLELDKFLKRAVLVYDYLFLLEEDEYSPEQVWKADSDYGDPSRNLRKENNQDECDRVMSDEHPEPGPALASATNQRWET